MKSFVKWATPCVLLVFSFCADAQNSSSQSAGKDIDPRPYYADPALSPDGAEIAFASGGDIWTMPAAGGEARLLISHPDNDSRPVYSTDGKFLAFNSTRTGNGDIYV